MARKMAKYGFSKLPGGGTPATVEIGVDASYGAAPAKGDLVYLDATTRLLLPCAANATEVYGVLDNSGPEPTSDGEYKLRVIIDENAWFYYPLNTGSTATVAFRGNSCDVASKQSLDLTHNEDVLNVEDVDLDNNGVWVTLIHAKRGLLAA